MDIEQLTKTQIVLLTLLVSFVTSIATGIVTVTLVDQAPPAVTQTINRVVERTVERTDSEGGQIAGAGGITEVITKEVQVVIKESDLITDAVARVGKSVVRVYTLGEEQDNSSDIRGAFLGMGLIISRDGFIVTDSTLVAPGSIYAVSTADGSIYKARLKNESANRPTAILEIDSSGEGIVFPPIAFADLSALKLGQSGIMISGKSRNVIAAGIVSDFISTGSEEAGTQIINTVNTDIEGTPVLGALLIDLLGEVTGIYTADDTSIGGASYTSNNVVKEQLAEVLATKGGQE